MVIPIVDEFEDKITLYVHSLYTACANAAVRSEIIGTEEEPKVSSGNHMTKLNMDVGPSKATIIQDHEPMVDRKEKKQLEPQHKGVCKEDEDVVKEVDDFPELALLPNEWTY
jgi:hypothetical protein